MGNALVISAGERSSALICSLLEQAGIDDVRHAASKEAAYAQFNREGLENIH